MHKPPPIFGDDATVPTTLAAADAGGGARLLVFGAEEPVSFPLSEPGTYTIGRSLEADIYVKDPSLSRVHASLTFDPSEGTLSIRDLGSSNGTRIRGRVVEANVDHPFEPGETVELGRCTIVIQQGAALESPRRVWPHTYFELRVEEHCSRAARSGEPFAIFRVRLKTAVPAAKIERALTTLLGPDDFIAAYAPSIYDILLARGGLREVDEASSALRFGLRKLGAEPELTVARFPADGRAPAELIGRLSGGAPLERVSLPGARSSIIIEDLSMQRLYQLVDRLGESEISVLILGETGVGKEIMARAIHERSKRREKPFLALNCGAFSSELLESELFGHERGAFTGAVAKKPGLLETVQGGTIFLDEIGEMPLDLQVKLLRVIEERRLRRVGGLDAVAFDARFIAATHRDLEAQVRRGTFREDLYYRLNGFTLLIPPLRERKLEIAALARAFAREALRREGRHEEPRLSAAALETLSRYAWPGNIRELRNVVERAVLLAAGSTIDVAHLPMEKLTAPVIFRDAPAKVVPEEDEDRPLSSPPGSSSAGAAGAAAAAASASALRARMADVERETILNALEQCGGNQTRAAELLGMSRKSLLRRLDSYDIPRPRKGRGDAE